MTESTANPPNPAPPTSTYKPAATSSPLRRKKNWLKTILRVSLILLALLLSLTLWIITTHSGLRFGLLTVPKWFGINITAEQLSGSVWQGFSGRNVQVNNRNFDLHIEKVKLDWNNQEIWYRHLHIKLLEVGNINYIGHSEPAPKPAPTLPRSIKLPVKITADKIILGGLSLGKKHNPILAATQASYVYDHKQHELIINE